MHAEVSLIAILAPCSKLASLAENVYLPQNLVGGVNDSKVFNEIEHTAFGFLHCVSN